LLDGILIFNIITKVMAKRKSVDIVKILHQADGVYTGLRPSEPWPAVVRLDEEFLGMMLVKPGFGLI
jgi:hypothetical protein